MSELTELRKKELRYIAEEAGKEGAKETLRMLGADVDRPLEMQADFQHLRKWRLLAGHASKSIIGIIIILTISGTGSLIWAAIKNSH